MRVLVAILSCRAHRSLEDAQRSAFEWQESNWQFPAGVEYDRKYFVGGSDTRLIGLDQVHLPVGDDVPGLPFKSRTMNQWAIERGYDWVFRGDTDCYIHLPRLLSAIPTDCEYSGFFRGNTDVPGGYASGGSGYWLSQTASQLIVQWPFTHDYEDERGFIRGEDLQVGLCMNSSKFWCKWDDRYRLDDILPAPDNNTITSHSVRNTLKTPQAMTAAHDWVVKQFTEPK